MSVVFNDCQSHAALEIRECQASPPLRRIAIPVRHAAPRRATQRRNDRVQLATDAPPHLRDALCRGCGQWRFDIPRSPARMHLRGIPSPNPRQGIQAARASAIHASARDRASSCPSDTAHGLGTVQPTARSASPASGRSRGWRARKSTRRVRGAPNENTEPIDDIHELNIGRRVVDLAHRQGPRRVNIARPRLQTVYMPRIGRTPLRDLDGAKQHGNASLNRTIGGWLFASFLAARADFIDDRRQWRRFQHQPLIAQGRRDDRLDRSGQALRAWPPTLARRALTVRSGR